MTPHILFVDDDPDIQTAARLLLTRRGFTMSAARTPAEAMTALACAPVDAVLLDLNYAPGATTGAEGIALLREMLAARPHLPVVVVTGHSGVAIAVTAMRHGAADFVMKPWNNERLLGVLRAALDRPRMPAAASAPVPHDAAPDAEDAPEADAVMIGTCAPMRHAFETAARIAGVNVNVLLTGAAGTGKATLARRIHRLGGDNRPPGVQHGAAFDIAALDAETTWILRDVDALNAQAQRALADRLDRARPPRLLATSRLDAAALQERMAPVLYFRLATIQITLPPLAARGDDVLELAHHYLQVFAHRHARAAPKPDDTQALLLRAQTWKQNLHEMRTMMERWVLLGPDAAFGSAPAPDDAPETATLARSERTIIEQALKRHGFNVSHAARELGLTRPALYRRMARYGF